MIAVNDKSFSVFNNDVLVDKFILNSQFCMIRKTADQYAPVYTGITGTVR